MNSLKKIFILFMFLSVSAYGYYVPTGAKSKIRKFPASEPISKTLEYYCNGLYDLKLDRWMCRDSKNETMLITVENYAREYTCGDFWYYIPITNKKESGLIVIKTIQNFKDCEF